MFENQIVKLADLCTDVSYGYTASADSNKVGPKFLRITDIQGGVVDWDEVPYCEIEEGKLKKNKLESGDIVVARTGNSTGENYLFLASVDAVFASYLIRFRVNPELANPYFVWLQLRTKKWWDYVSGAKSGSAQAGANAKVLGQFEFYLPEREIQDRASNTVLNFNEKIELNTQTNQTLEQMAQAIFKSWFVDFDPVKAKIEALATGGSTDDAELAAMSVISAKTVDELNSLKASNPEAFNKLAQTAALFPAAMQDSELGEIPEGWEVSDLASCTTELRRGISPKYIEEGGVLVINQKCIRNHTIDFSLARRNDSSKRKVDGREIVIGDVLVNSTGVGTLGRLAPIRFLNETTVADSHVTVVRANTTKISKSFLAGLMLTNEAYIEASGAGSTGQTELRKQVLEDIKFVKPLSAVDRLFDEIASNFNAQIAELEKQRVTLSLTRDALLPKLLSGELVGE